MLGYTEVFDTPILQGLDIVALEKEGVREYQIVLFGDRRHTLFPTHESAVCAGLSLWAEVQKGAIDGAVHATAARFHCNQSEAAP